MFSSVFPAAWFYCRVLWDDGIHFTSWKIATPSLIGIFFLRNFCLNAKRSINELLLLFFGLVNLYSYAFHPGQLPKWPSHPYIVPSSFPEKWIKRSWDFLPVLFTPFLSFFLSRNVFWAHSILLSGLTLHSKYHHDFHLLGTYCVPEALYILFHLIDTGPQWNYHYTDRKIKAHRV